jgi:hypothetical protein
MAAKTAPARPIHIGWAHTSITPEQPVQLAGQFRERISEEVRDPVTATVLALEAPDAEGGPAQAMVISCDLVRIPGFLQNRVRRRVAEEIEGFDPAKLFCCATHTHTAPEMKPDVHPQPPEGVMAPADYCDFFVERVAAAAAEAWRARRPGGVSWALGWAAVGFNRRAVYHDGTARMYGNSDAPDFRRLEGGNDHGVEMLFCWDRQGAITGVVINLACPSQVVESWNFVSADFWSAVRRRLKAACPGDPEVLALTGAAGDQSPRDLVRRGRGEADFRRESGLEEMGRRIAAAVEGALESAREEVRTEVVFEHLVERAELPARKLSQEEADAARRRAEELAAANPDPRSREAYLLRRNRRLVEDFERQADEPVAEVELHALRIGEVALVTNPFELFLDYGLRIKARSRAQQTFVAQLACDCLGYLPTAEAEGGGGYGATALNGPVGPAGGDALVELSVEAVNRMWPAEPD